jgi:AcrR family transcriptional regulator
MPRGRFGKLPPDKRARILEAAFEEFARRGLDKASTNRIAVGAQVSKSLLFYYFDDKQDLFAAVVGEVSRELLGALAPPSEAPSDPAAFWAAFEALYGQLFDALERRPSMRAFVIAFVRTQSMTVDNPLLAEAVAGATAVFEQIGRASCRERV